MASRMVKPAWAVAGLLLVLCGGARGDDRGTLIALGVERLLKGSGPEAVATLVQARKMDTNEPAVHMALGAALLLSERYGAAAEEFRQALSLTQEATVRQVCWSGLGVCWLRTGQYSEAVSKLGHVGGTGDDSATAQACLAYALLQSGDAMRARYHAGLAMGDRSAMEMALNVTGRTYLVQEPHLAVEFLRRALRWSREGAGKVGLSEQRALPALALPGYARLNPVREMRVSVTRADAENILIEPAFAPEGTGSVALSLDGVPRGATNQHPFRFSVRARALAAGRHTAALDAFDAGGGMLASAAAGFEAAGAAPAGSAADGAQLEQAREVAARLAPVVRPVSDLPSLHYALGTALERTGALREAAQEYEVAFAARAEQADVARRLLAVYQRLGIAGGGRSIAVPPQGSRVVALTFDDGPSPLFTPKLLKILRQHHVKATFFMVGMQVLTWPDLARQIADEGHEVANHSFSHPNCALLTPEQVQQEILRAKVVIRQATGRNTRLFRPPGGRFNGPALRAVGAVGHTSVMWTSNILSGDTRDPAATAVRMARQLRGGGIALLHNGRDGTLEVLPLLLARLEKRGVRFATVSELLSPKNARGR